MFISITNTTEQTTLSYWLLVTPSIPNQKSHFDSGTFLGEH